MSEEEKPKKKLGEWLKDRLEDLAWWWPLLVPLLLLVWLIAYRDYPLPYFGATPPTPTASPRQKLDKLPAVQPDALLTASVQQRTSACRIL